MKVRCFIPGRGQYVTSKSSRKNKQKNLRKVNNKKIIQENFSKLNDVMSRFKRIQHISQTIMRKIHNQACHHEILGHLGIGRGH